MSKKVALVTGAAQGIGRGVAKRFLEDGYQVVLSDIDEAQGQKTLNALKAGKKAIFVTCDVSNETDVASLIKQSLKAFSRIDVLVNNAAIADPHAASLEETDFAAWERVIRVNLGSVFLVTKAALPALKKSKGVIINMSSTRALMSEPHSEAYAACKGGVVAMSHALAISLGPDIRVHCVSPGWIDTRNSKLREKDHKQHPVGRVGVPEDIAGVCSFLASKDSSFMTGQNIIVDGGMVRKMIYED